MTLKTDSSLVQLPQFAGSWQDDTRIESGLFLHFVHWMNCLPNFIINSLTQHNLLRQSGYSDHTRSPFLVSSARSESSRTYSCETFVPCCIFFPPRHPALRTGLFTAKDTVFS